VTAAAGLPRRASGTELAILRHPDRRTSWIVVWAATLEAPLEAATLGERLARLHAALPLVGARLRAESWLTGPAPEPLVIEGEPLAEAALLHRFELAGEGPLRVLLAPERRRLALAFHHAAFDGMAIASILTALMGGPLPEPGAPPARRASGRRRRALSRLLWPADPVAPSTDRAGECLLVREVRLSGKGVTGRIAAACVAAAGARNAATRRDWRRIGVSVAIRGPGGGANTASYRRVDLGPGDPVAERVAEAMESDAEPPELASPGRALRLLTPLSDRFSDSLLISNMGRQPIPGLARLEAFPVARGRSAVAFGAAGLERGPTTLTLRSRDLARGDAEALLDDAVARLGGNGR
jgi:hypothetical protein